VFISLIDVLFAAQTYSRHICQRIHGVWNYLRETYHLDGPAGEMRYQNVYLRFWKILRTLDDRAVTFPCHAIQNTCVKCLCMCYYLRACMCVIITELLQEASGLNTKNHRYQMPTFQWHNLVCISLYTIHSTPKYQIMLWELLPQLSTTCQSVS